MENTQTTKKYNFLMIGAATLAAAMTISVAAPSTSVFASEAETPTYTVGQTVGGTGTTVTVLGETPAEATQDPWYGIDPNNPVLGNLVKGVDSIVDDVPTIDGQSITEFDKYVTFDSETNAYYINRLAQVNLTPQTLEELTQIVDANNVIRASVLQNNTKNNVDVSKEGIVTITSKNDYDLRFKEGKNAVKAYWWGLRVWLKKSTVNNMGTGVTIAGIWIPHPVVKGVVATAGVLIGKAPGGIVFNYTPGVNAWGVKFQ